MVVLTNDIFVKKCVDIAENQKTVYAAGCFGIPVDDDNIKHITAYRYNRQRERKNIIRSRMNKGYLAYDASGLIVGVLRHFNIDCPNFVDRISALTDDFSKIAAGEILLSADHYGIYIGDGLAVECCNRWTDNVQVTAVRNIAAKPGYNSRVWERHGKLDLISYGEKYSGTLPKLSEKASIQLNDEGTQVKRLQRLLNWCLDLDTPVDGVVNDETEENIKKYQEKYGLDINGIFDRSCLDKAKTIVK